METSFDTIFRRRTGKAAPGRRWFPGLAAGLLFAATFIAVAAYQTLVPGEPFYLEIKVASDRPGELRIGYDAGTGFKDENDRAVSVEACSDYQVENFPIPVRTIKALRIQPTGTLPVMWIEAISLRRSTPVWASTRHYYSFDLNNLRPEPETTALTHEGEAVRIAAIAEDRALTGEITLPEPLFVGVDWWRVLCRSLPPAAGWLLLWIVLGASRWWRTGGPERAVAWARGRWWHSPGRAIWLVAAASVVLSCYPVIFCGKSFASSDFSDGTYQLYGQFPTLPGGHGDPPLENGMGSDLGSMAWAHGPYAVVQSRALFQDHELPLWNRYNTCGLPLLGQGQSMFGDPLHFLVIAGGGSAWAWDLKFLLAKLVFAAGVGLLVLAATECVPAALLLCFSSAFLGFFSYRLNHPAYFSLCYAPWILFTWLEIVRAATWRRAMGWTGGLILANWTELNSGTAKEAYMLLLCLNLTGVAVLWADRQSWGSKLRRSLGLLGAGLIFCLLAAPILLAFFDTLQKSASGYGVPHAFQLQPSLLIGLFDDIFYRQFNTGESKMDPAANFLVLFGTLVSLGGFQRLIGHRTFAAVFASALPPLALVFGVVPSSLIRATPFLGNIFHVDNTFSCVLFIQLFVIAGFGLKYCLTQDDRSAWRRELLTAFLIGGALLGAYAGGLHAAQRSDITFLGPDQQIPVSPFFLGYVPSLVLALLALPFALRRLRARGPEFTPVVLLACCLFLLHWRNGLQVHTPFAAYTPVLPNRTDWFARSAAVDYLRDDRTSPFRVFGLSATFYYGYGMVAGLETIHGVDALANGYIEKLEIAAADLTRQRFSEKSDLTHLGAAKPFQDLLNIRYFVTLPGDTRLTVPAADSLPMAGVSLAARLDLDVYRNDTAWPRAFFVDRLNHYDGAAEFAASVVAGDGRPFAAVEADDLRRLPWLAGRFEGAAAARTVVAASDYHLTNAHTAFTVDAPGAGVVVLTEAYYPGDILAKVNGRPVPVFRVNHAFRGLALDGPGRYRISFAYRPPGFTRALGASALGWLLLAAAGWALRRAGRAAAGTAPVEKLDPPGHVP